MADRKQDAKYTAVGGVLGAAAMPVRAENNSKGNPYKHLSEGVHQMPIRDVQRFSRRTGPRIQNRKYTAAMANHLGRGTDTKPVDIRVHNDGSTSQADGAHRIWARSMQGEKTIPVQVHHTGKDRPAGRRAAHELMANVASRHQRWRLKQDTNIGQHKIDSLAGKLNPKAKKTNMKWSAKGNQNPIAANAKRAQMSNKELRGKQAAYIGGGLALGYGASKVRDKFKKNDSLSAFGVDHGY